MYDQNDYIVYQDGIARVIEVENNQVIIEDYISQEIKNINHHHIIRKICSLETIKDIKNSLCSSKESFRRTLSRGNDEI